MAQAKVLFEAGGGSTSEPELEDMLSVDSEGIGFFNEVEEE